MMDRRRFLGVSAASIGAICGRPAFGEETEAASNTSVTDNSSDALRSLADGADIGWVHIDCTRETLTDALTAFAFVTGASGRVKASVVADIQSGEEIPEAFHLMAQYERVTVQVVSNPSRSQDAALHLAGATIQVDSEFGFDADDPGASERLENARREAERLIRLAEQAFRTRKAVRD